MMVADRNPCIRVFPFLVKEKPIISPDVIKHPEKIAMIRIAYRSSYMFPSYKSRYIIWNKPLANENPSNSPVRNTEHTEQ